MRRDRPRAPRRSLRRGSPDISPRAATLRRRPLDRASVRCPLNGAPPRAPRGPAARVAARTASARPSRPAAGSCRTRTPVNHPVPGPSRHSTGPANGGAAGHERVAERRDVGLVDLTEEPQRHVPARRPDEAQPLGLAELELEAAQAAPGLVVGPGGDEEAHVAAGGAGLRRRRRRAAGGPGRSPRCNAAMDFSSGPPCLEDASLHGECLTGLGRIGVARAGAPQRVHGHVGQLLEHPLEALGHVDHGLVRDAHLGSGVVCTS